MSNETVDIVVTDAPIFVEIIPPAPIVVEVNYGGSGSGGSGVQSVTSDGVYVTVDNADPLNPVVDFSTGFKTAYSGLVSTVNDKQDVLVSGTNIKTINGSSILGSGDLVVGGSVSAPAGELLYGTGTGYASSSKFRYNSTTEELKITGTIYSTDNTTFLTTGGGYSQIGAYSTKIEIDGGNGRFFFTAGDLYSTQKSYFGGYSPTPTARIHVTAGTATAGTAPIKLTTGTALTTPEDGVFEYHTSHLYFTIGSTRYQLDQQASGYIPYTGATTNVDLGVRTLQNTSSITTQVLNGVSGNISIFSSATTGGAIGITLNNTGGTGHTASTAISGLQYSSGARSWNAGTITAQKEVSLQTVTYNFAGASVITNSYGLYVEPMTAGTNATITNNWAAGFNGQIQATGINKVTITQPTTSATLTLVTGSSLITAGAFALTLTSTATTNATFPTGTITLVDLAATQTLTGTKTFSGAITFSGTNTITFGARNFVLDTTTGTKFGTATSQKLAFYNATPVIQQTTGVTGAAYASVGGSATSSLDTYGGYTIGQIVAALKLYGFLA